MSSPRGLVFIGNAAGDEKGGKGQCMNALDAKTGKIAWDSIWVPKTEGDPVRGPQGSLTAQRIDVEELARSADQRLRAPGRRQLSTPLRGSCMFPAATQRRTSTSARGRGRIAITDLSCRARRQDRRLTRPISRLCPRIGTTGMSPTHPSLIHTNWREASHGIGAEGWAPLWLRSCRPPPPSAGDHNRQCRGGFLDR